MSQADTIRQYVIDHYVVPARARGEGHVTIRAGDVHRDMKLANAMPAVCSAVGGRRLEALADIGLVKREGPRNGANVYFTFQLAEVPPGLLEKQSQFVAGASATAEQPLDARPRRERPDLDGSLVLVSCVKSKQVHPAPARELYASPLFRGVRQLVESSNASWLILSALHGLVAPSDVIAPYEYTLNTAGIAARRAWARKVLEKLLPVARKHERVVIFAGQRYREFLVGPLEEAGIACTVPMEGLALGEQLAWLAERT